MAHKNPQIITMYLPQFHRVKENDQWWGEGYTEWTAVKLAKPLFEGHEQPVSPLNDNYYDLLQRETMEWQASLMKEYGVYGQCFYHYYFKNGRKILEKPAQNLLKWTDIDMPFCFCWANTPWTRTWSKYTGSFLADKFENKEVPQNDTNGVLLEQDYGEKKAWKVHYEYLRPFFRDKRYIRMENRPVFVIHNYNHIRNSLAEMIWYWSELAQQYEEEIPYIITFNSNGNAGAGVDAEAYIEPAMSFGKVQKKMVGNKKIQVVDYDQIWESILYKSAFKKKTFFGGFSNYDETPRRDKNGLVVLEGTAEKFERYMTELLAKSYVEENEFVFVNAWNEWGEGMHVEPDKCHQYDFLQALQQANMHYKEYIDKYKNIKRYDDYNATMYNDIRRRMNRAEMNYRISNNLLLLRERKKTIGEFLLEKGNYSIAIYGMGHLGKHLCIDCQESGVDVKFYLDKKEVIEQDGIPVYSPDRAHPSVDGIIVTPCYDFDSIRKKLEECGYTNIMSLEKITMDILTKECE